MADNQVEVEIVLAVKEATDNIKKLQSGIENFSKEASKSFSFANLSFASFTGNLASQAATQALSLMKSGIGLMVDELGRMINEASSGEAALNRMNTALMVSGNYSKKASADLQEFANQIQKTTKYEDDAVLESIALTSTLTGLSADGLKKATQAAIDLSAALKIDLETATSMVSKGVNGSSAAINKVGISFKDTGDSAKNLSLIITEVGSKMGGMAVSAANTFEGSIEKTKNAVNAIRESMGLLIIQNPALTGAMKAVSDMFVGFGDKVNENKKTITDFINNGILLFIDALKMGVSALGIIMEKVDSCRNQFDYLSMSIDLIKAAFYGAVGGISSFSAAVAKLTGDIFGEQKALEEYAKKMDETSKAHVAAASEHAKTILDRNASTKTLIDNSQKLLDQIRAETEESIAKYSENKDAYVQSNNEKIEAQNQYFTDKQLLEEAQKETNAQKLEEEKINEQLKNDEKYQMLVDNLGREEAARAMSQARKLQDEGKHEQAVKLLQDTNAKARANSLVTQNRWETDSNKQRVAMAKETLGQIASLTASNNDTLFAIGKASSIALATINVGEAVTKTLAYYPAPLNFAIAGLVGVAGAVQIAKIASTPKPAYANGGIVPSGFPNDTYDARLTSSEMVLNQRQQATLFNMANGGGQQDNSALVTAINNLASRPVIVEINGREIARSVRDERAAGFAV